MTALSSATGPAHPPLLETMLGALLDEVAEARPEADAIVDGASGRRLSYEELRSASDRAARGLLGLGVAPGDRVGLWTSGVLETVVVSLAVAKAGAMLVPFDSETQAEVLAERLIRCGVRVLFLDGAVRLDTLGRIRSAVPALRWTVLADDTPVGGPLPNALRIADLELAAASIGEEALGARALTFGGDDACALVPAEHPDGAPLDVVLSHRTVVNDGRSAGDGCALGPSDRIFLAPSPDGGAALVLGLALGLTRGAALVRASRAEPASAFATAVGERCSVIFGDPAFFAALLDPGAAGIHTGREAGAGLRAAIVAGGAASPELMHHIAGALDVPEVTMLHANAGRGPLAVGTLRDDPLERRFAGALRPLPHVTIEIVGADGVAVPRGTRGELRARGGVVRRRAWNDAAASSAAIDSRGFVATGRSAVMHGDGSVVLETTEPRKRFF